MAEEEKDKLNSDEDRDATRDDVKGVGPDEIPVADVETVATGETGSGSSDGKASTLNRVIARFIDILIALLLAKLPGYVGFLAGLTYIGIADGLWSGQSIGKRIIGLRVLRASGRTHCDFRDSILRNSTIGVYYALFQIPLVGWALALFGLGFELLLMIGSAEGMRLGDEIAGTVAADEPRQDTE